MTVLTATAIAWFVCPYFAKLTGVLQEKVFFTGKLVAGRVSGEETVCHASLVRGWNRSQCETSI